MKQLEDYVMCVPDFPKKGIMFRDITSILHNPEGLRLAIDSLQSKIEGLDFDVIIGPEARGFLFAMPIAYNLNKAFVPVRKPGKLPRETISASYDLEYGTAELQIHKDAITPGQRVIIIDDLMATGGTNEAIIHLVEELGGQVIKAVFLMELKGLEGRKKMRGIEVESIIEYPGI